MLTNEESGNGELVFLDLLHGVKVRFEAFGHAFIRQPLRPRPTVAAFGTPDFRFRIDRECLVLPLDGDGDLSGFFGPTTTRVLAVPGERLCERDGEAIGIDADGKAEALIDLFSRWQEKKCASCRQFPMRGCEILIKANRFEFVMR